MCDIQKPGVAPAVGAARIPVGPPGWRSPPRPPRVTVAVAKMRSCNRSAARTSDTRTDEDGNATEINTSRARGACARRVGSAARVRRNERRGARQARQNPVGNLISLPFQNNTNLNFGPEKGTQNILNIQPVIPISVNDEWNVITRTIVPVIWNPPLGPGDDRHQRPRRRVPAFLSPGEAGQVDLGCGAVPAPDEHQRGARQQELGSGRQPSCSISITAARGCTACW